MSELSFYFITALLYVVLAVSSWQRALQSRASPTPMTAVVPMAWQRGVLAVVLCLHAFLLVHDMLGGVGFNLNLGTALSLIVWLTGVIYWIESYWVQVGILQNFILPVAAICVFLPYFMREQHVLTYANMSLFKSHLAISMLAYGLLTIAALHGFLLSVLEKRLHKGNLPVLLNNLPPLMSLERLTFRILFAGFVLLTLTLLSGVSFSEALFGKPFRLNHKVIFGFIAWAIFGFLLLGRHFWGWRGRIAVRWLLSGFGFLLLAYLGSKFVLEVILQR